MNSLGLSMSPFVMILIHLSLEMTHVSSDCRMDACNPQRTSQIDSAVTKIPDSNLNLKIEWTYSSKERGAKKMGGDEDGGVPLYLGCVSSDAEEIVSCLLSNSIGITTLNANDGGMIWNQPGTGENASEISSTFLLPGSNAAIVNDGVRLWGFLNGTAQWAEQIANSSSLSPFSVGLIEPQYFPVRLGDGRFALYDFALGLCWASLYLKFRPSETVFYPSASTAAINSIFYLPANEHIQGDSLNSSIFSFHTGSINNRVKFRFNWAFTGNGIDSRTGIVVSRNEDERGSLNILFIGDGCVYCLIDENQEEIDPKKVHLRWKRSINNVTSFGIVLDPLTYLGGTSFWICDFENGELFLKEISMINGSLVNEMSVNDLVGADKGVALEVVSRGLSGITSMNDRKAIVFCVKNEMTGQVSLIVVDLEKQEMISQFVWSQGEPHCVGQLGVVNRKSTQMPVLIVPLSDESSVVAIG